MRNIKARTHACTCAQVADSGTKAQRMGRFLGLGLLLEQRLEMTVSRPTSLSGRFSSQMKRGDPSSFFKLRLKWVHVLSNLLTKRKELRNLRWLEFHLFVV